MSRIPPWYRVDAVTGGDLRSPFGKVLSLGARLAVPVLATLAGAMVALRGRA